MNKFKFLAIPLLLLSMSCNSSVKLFNKKTAHEAYADKIEKTPAGKQWIAVSINTLTTSHSVQLPYYQLGHFPAGQPRALTLEFTARRGERIVFNMGKRGDNGNLPYADIFIKEETGTDHLLSADTMQQQFSFDADRTATYLLRLQPELYNTVTYDLSISIAPSLDFPVAGNKAKAGSFWGDDRDAGKRKHEGVDIFAPKLTPVLAAADGYITGVREGGIGGKTIWMKVTGKNYHLYYAHLDKQLVENGQRVKIGDTIGLVGNTGNARYTPAHLHFGVYTFSGPVDPWPFVNKTIRSPSPVRERDLNIALELKTKSQVGINNQLLVPLAVNDTDYIAETAEGKIVSASFGSVKQIRPDKPVSVNGIATTDLMTNTNN